MPVLVQVYSHDYSPAGLAILSLSLVLLNALTSLVLGKQSANVDWSFAKPVAVLSALGALIGVYIQTHVSRGPFETYLAILLLVLGVYTVWKAPLADASVALQPEPFGPPDAVVGTLVGTVASFFGVGGGVLQVPYMVYFRKRAVKQATATSQVILGSVACVSLLVFTLVVGAQAPWEALLYMAPSVVLGGIIGSRLSARMRGPWIVRLLGVVLLFLAYRIA